MGQERHRFALWGWIARQVCGRGLQDIGSYKPRLDLTVAIRHCERTSLRYMTTHYPSLEAAFRDCPVRIADWGYFECRETDLAASGVEFFDDVEDPGHCRRAAFAGSGGHLVVLTVYADPKVNEVVFACDAKIAGKSDLLNVLPEPFHRWVDMFEIVYFGQPV